MSLLIWTSITCQTVSIDLLFSGADAEEAEEAGEAEAESEYVLSLYMR